MIITVKNTVGNKIKFNDLDMGDMFSWGNSVDPDAISIKIESSKYLCLRNNNVTRIYGVSDPLHDCDVTKWSVNSIIIEVNS